MVNVFEIDLWPMTKRKPADSKPMKGTASSLDLKMSMAIELYMGSHLKATTIEICPDLQWKMMMIG